MSIDRAAIQGAFGAAYISRQTKEGHQEQRTNLEAMATYYKGKGDKEREAECRQRIKDMDATKKTPSRS